MSAAVDPTAPGVARAAAPELSVVVPVFNERDNIPPLVGEIVAALRGKLPFEIVYVVLVTQVWFRMG